MTQKITEIAGNALLTIAYLAVMCLTVACNDAPTNNGGDTDSQAGETDTDKAPDSSSDIDTFSDLDTDSDSGAITDTNPDAYSGSGADSDVDTGGDADTDTKGDADTEKITEVKGDCEGKIVPVAVGGGSYASCPIPGTLGEDDEVILQSMNSSRPIYMTDANIGRPIPTNDWWTALLVNDGNEKLFAYPAALETVNGTGVVIRTMTDWDYAGDNGFHVVQSAPVRVSGAGMSPGNALADDWADWLLRFVMPDGDMAMTTTVLHGSPYTWFEFKGTTAEATFENVDAYDEAGAAVTFPYTGGALAVVNDGIAYGLFAPKNTVFSKDGNTLQITSDSLVVATMKGVADLTLFAQYAAAVPRNSEISWDYRPAEGKVNTHWQIVCENLHGLGNVDTLQGWIPHHYKRTALSFELLPKLEWFTPRGTLKVSAGHVFDITYPFIGILPKIAAPEVLDGAANAYQPTRMTQLLDDYRGHTEYGGDTYWGGKDLVNYAKYMNFAFELGNTELFNTYHDTLRAAMEDWYTYTPGEKEHLFAAYPRWKALVGMGFSYWSQEFTDHHFHYGYHTYAAGILGMYDADFAAKYGEMATLVAKEYANYNRNDKNFPFLRTFDIWMGHSYAGGLGDPGSGNNQESSSEAMQSWTGLFLLGVATKNPVMRDAGIFGYTVESRAVAEYWFDRDHENFPSEWTHEIASVVRNDHIGYWTYFGDEPVYKHGIQWLPIAPSFYYLVEDYDYAAMEYQSLLDEAKDDEANWGTWANVSFGYAQLFDAAYVVQRLDELWDAGHDVMKENTAILNYYYAHSNRALGHVDWSKYTDMPTGLVYEGTGKGHRISAYNPGDGPLKVTVYARGGGPLTSFDVPARSLLTHTEKLK
ncbi:MAG: hypothetical protein JXR76_17005 [Deltaproteobacteria bacterium]|nr:hypothetical protein [Deltaproteobacteria bacterium]